MSRAELMREVAAIAVIGLIFVAIWWGIPA